MISLRHRAVSGVAWTTIARMGNGLVQVATTVLLVRSLVPEDYGLIGMASVILGFASLVGDFGFTAALVQTQRLDDVYTSSVFWLQTAIGAALAIFFYIGAPWVGGFYETPALTPVVRVLSVGFFFSAIGCVPTALLQRTMAFDRLAWAEILSALLSGLLAVAMALAGFGVWSLVAQLLTMNLGRAALTACLCRWRPRVIFSPAAIRGIWGYSVNLLAFNSVNYWSRNSDGLLIGRLIGSAGLGFYTRAISLLAPSAQIIGVVSAVMFPALSSIQADPSRVAQTYLRTVRAIALVTFPLLFGLLVVADSVVLILFGTQWMPMVPALKVLCLVAVVRTLHSPLGWLFTSRGRTDWMFRWGVVSSSVTVLILVVGALHGTIVSVAWAYLAAVFLLLYPSITIAGKTVGLRFVEVIGVVAGALACSASMALVIWALGSTLPRDWSEAVRLAVQVLAGGITYTALVMQLDLAGFRDVRGVLVEHWRRRQALNPAAGI